MIRNAIAALTATALAASPALPCAAPAMLVFDGSASMDEISFETGPNTRIVEARQAIRRAMPEITPHREVGLVIYGPGGADSCSGIEVRFPPAPDTAAEIIQEIGALRPSGLTPLSAAVERAAQVLDYQTQPAVVVLVTDGNETCGGRPCALGQRLAETAQDLTVHVIGFRAVVDFFSWNNPEQDPTTNATVARCLADLNGGLFVSTETVDALVDALNQTLGCALIGRLEGAERAFN
ncbi:hypothetical protein AIOL_002889 [Candidatus Rhodobacter oscarellae]|uniref:VWFA domain-containing protein n=1 Tax=Candidatus Rhodobacter oscarellae TaxID=1675527 RepID=A0A0J9E5F4_9RHOB|nr:VWA domain-containing protein [Candidatus Rhodobacter lobularis]KMW57921.1 hypothetical protein AIOL_002889 [Candidatus Rhodobacter lobularis]